MNQFHYQSLYLASVRLFILLQYLLDENVEVHDTTLQSRVSASVSVLQSYLFREKSETMRVSAGTPYISFFCNRDYDSADTTVMAVRTCPITTLLLALSDGRADMAAIEKLQERLTQLIQERHLLILGRRNLEKKISHMIKSRALTESGASYSLSLSLSLLIFMSWVCK
jgi:hypothetical protein